VTTAMAVYALAQEPNPVVTLHEGLSKLSAVILPRPRPIALSESLGVQIEDANKAKDKKTADVLTEK
jgi:hypothetical protein